MGRLGRVAGHGRGTPVMDVHGSGHGGVGVGVSSLTGNYTARTVEAAGGEDKRLTARVDGWIIQYREVRKGGDVG